jgi:hypothetical protein
MTCYLTLENSPEFLIFHHLFLTYWVSLCTPNHIIYKSIFQTTWVMTHKWTIIKISSSVTLSIIFWQLTKKNRTEWIE